MKKDILHKYILSFLLTIVILSCSTEKNTFVNRNFHNLNSHYNVYFNGNEAMKAGLEKIETRMEEDFTKILPVFKESLPNTETMVMSEMNTAVEKGLKLIKRHSITKPPESSRKQKNPRKRKPTKAEYNKWVDDAYLMIGKAYLYQKDYIRAASTFTQIVRKYKDDPVKYQAYLWLVRTYSESERYTESRELIETLEGNDQFPNELEGELAINAADLHLKQQHYDEAIQYLNIGIKKIKGNQRKIRYTFILAQLYQETGNKEKALEAYHQVIRRRPDYQIMFNAQINMAGVYSGDGNASILRKELNKMKKKKRNEPFLDQIYYALGNILFNEGQINDAIELYKKSAAVSINNKHQRALSCLTLADIYFEQKNYVPSGQYYDSAMVEIDESYPNYKAIFEKHASLNRLVGNLLTVEAQDSLQLLAGLSESELNRKIEGWIALEEARIAKDSVNEMNDGSSEYDMAYGRATSGRMRVNSGSSFYFYNPSTISYGKKEFTRLWGTRKNEDNWRRKNKSISLSDESEDGAANDLVELIEEEEEARSDDKTTREYYLQDIPGNDSLMALSHEQIRDALFNAGTIFKNEFNDYERAIDCFNELNRRYPQNIYELPSYFYLWDLYTTVEKNDSTEYYKNLILNSYPNSNYAKYLTNPNFFIEDEARKDSINSLYSLAYNSYKNELYGQAIRYSKMAKSMNPDSSLIPKLRFIEMVSASKGLPTEAFVDSLNAYIAQYPEAPTSQLAKQIFDLVKEDKLSDYQSMVNTGYINEVIKNMELLPQNQSSDEQTVSKWDSDNSLLHYFVIAIPTDEKIDVNRLKFDIANYNIDHYTTLDFDIENEPLNKENELIIVRNFDDKENALIYFLSIIRKPQVFKTLAGKKFINFIISNNNYREMLSDRSYNEYIKFFVQNYSSFTSGEFLDEELETPEQLMARLKQDNNEFKEQGEFVVVKTDDGSYQAPEPKEQIYSTGYDVPHSMMILMKEPRFRTGFLMRDFVKFNSEKFSINRLRVTPTNLKESTLLVISQFPDAYEASQYLKIVNNDQLLFNAIGETPYETFIISNDNLSKLRETNNIEAWSDFYNVNYVYRKPPAPVKTPEVMNENGIDQNNSTDVQLEKKEVEIPETTPELNNVQENTDQTSVPEGNTEIEEQENNEPSQQVVPEETATVQPVVENIVENIVEEETALSYNGPFVYDSTAMYNLIYLLPSTGSNQTLLTTYVGRFNAMKYRSFGLDVKAETFDDFRSVVVISGIGDAAKARAYQDDINADSRVGMSLRNVNYKSYLIANENLEQLKKSKDIQEYQKFYSVYFKEQ